MILHVKVNVPPRSFSFCWLDQAEYCGFLGGSTVRLLCGALLTWANLQYVVKTVGKVRKSEILAVSPGQLTINTPGREPKWDNGIVSTQRPPADSQETTGNCLYYVSIVFLEEKIDLGHLKKSRN